MSSKKRVGVIMGGMSGEYEVSLVSGKSVINSLDKNKYDAVPITITKDGKWSNNIISADPNQQSFDVILPILHGTYGEDGKIQGLLEMANLPYVGAGVIGSAAAMDKIVAKQLFETAGLNNVNFEHFLSKDWQKNQSEIIDQIESSLNYPIFVKPANLGSSVGINKVNNKKELVESINEAVKYDRRIIIEESIENCNEIECAVLGNDEPKASVLGEIIPDDDFYSYNDKYIDNKTKLVIPAELSAKIIKNVQEMSIKAFKALDLCGMARVDFLINKDKIFINEVNTIPGFTKISMYPKLWEASGLPYEKLLDELINLAVERHQEKNRLKTTFELGSNINV